MILWLAAPALAWDVNSYDWAWSDAPAPETFELNRSSFDDPTATETAFLAAIDVWNMESGADLFLAYGGTTTVTKQGGGNDDHNAVLFGDKSWGAGLAVATSTTSSGDLVDCDIQVWESNLYGTIDWHVGASGASGDAYDLQHTLTHELGHCLGMAHSDTESAIMYSYSIAGTGEDRRHLFADDLGGIQYLYGEVAPELTATVDGDPPGAGASFELTVRVENVGDGTAWLVDVEIPQTGPLGGGSAAVGNVGSPTPVGERVGPSVVEVVVPLAVGPGCEVDAVDVDLVLTAHGGAEWVVPVTVALDCATDPVDPDDTDALDDTGGEARAGCGCASGAVGPWWVGLLALGGLRRRRG